MGYIYLIAEAGVANSGFWDHVLVLQNGSLLECQTMGYLYLMLVN